VTKSFNIRENSQMFDLFFKIRKNSLSDGRSSAVQILFGLLVISDECSSVDAYPKACVVFEQ